jgi:hypothetical protein
MECVEKSKRLQYLKMAFGSSCLNFTVVLGWTSSVLLFAYDRMMKGV